MESLGDEPWDTVICGTGLQQSLLALALSRSNKRILHLDPHDYYGQHEAAFSLQEVESWVATHDDTSQLASASAKDSAILPNPVASEDHVEMSETFTNPGGITQATQPQRSLFRNLDLWKHPEAEANGLSFPRAYSLALAPQIIHTRSKLLSQLVSSRAYRQVDFLAVGSFFVCEAAKDGTTAELSRIPSSREDVFANQSIPSRSKRSLMKFLKFVLDYDSEEQTSVWESQANDRLADFLTSHFKLDDDLRKYILALTLTLDGNVSVKDGLATINRHLTSMGLFGPGFCAVYPKWGGLSEIAQVACRAGAVGGGIYMLGTSMKIGPVSESDTISLDLSNGISIQTKTLISSREVPLGPQTVSRLIAVVNSPLKPLFEVIVDGAPTPAVAVVAFPSNTTPSTETTPDTPVYAVVHSSDTGECPSGQSVVYLTTLASAGSKERFGQALESLLSTAEQAHPICLYKLYYEQTVSERAFSIETIGSAPKFSFPSPSLGLAFNDVDLDSIKEAWRLVVGSEIPDAQYMVFEDREGADAEDDVYD